jgi:hypothetical protein
MEEQGVYMDVEAVQGMADSFSTMSDLLLGIERVMHAAMLTLRSTAFVGMVGGAAVERYLGTIQPLVKRLADKFHEMHLDLLSAVVYYRDGEESGRRLFYN